MSTSNFEIAFQSTGNLQPPSLPIRTVQWIDDHLFDFAYQQFPQPVWMVDPVTLELLRVNHAMCTDLGMARADLLKLTEAELCAPEDAGRLLAFYGGVGPGTQSSADTGNWVTYSRQQKLADGSFCKVQLRFVEVNYQGRSARLVVAHSLRQRRQDTGFRQQIEVLKSLVANAGYGLGRYCVRRGRLVVFNQHLLDLLGCADEKVHALPETASQPCNYIEQSFANVADWEEFLGAARALQMFQKIVLWRSQKGVLRYMRLHCVPTETSDGVQMDMSVEDATEAVRHEQQFRQSQKMEALGRMAGGVAHDFNNLLLVIRGHAEMLEESLPKDSDLRRHTTKLMTASRQAADITGTLVTFSRGEEPLLGLLPLNQAIRAYAHLMPSFLRADVLLDMDLAPEEFHILANSTHVEQVVLNLCVNARDAMPEGGRVTVRTKFVPGNSVEQMGSVMLEVSDTGVGMDAETRAHIFEPFYTTKARGKGTGLGLALVYGIVTQYGGRIEVDTEIGRGTSFRIFFPLGEYVRPIAPRTVRLSERKTILLVDDQPEIRVMVGEFLKRLGHEVLCAGDGREALEKAAAHPGEIDLLLTDVLMPHVGGFELADRLQHLRPGLDVLIMSGYTGGVSAKGGNNPHGFPFLAKPFSMRQLESSLGLLLSTSTPAGENESSIAEPAKAKRDPEAALLVEERAETKP